MNKPVFIINGSGGSGKDTFCELVNQIINTKTYSSVDIIKSYALLVGWNGIKDEKGRRLLSDLKNALTLYNDELFKYLERCVKQYNENNKFHMCFLHIREPQEIERAKKRFNAGTVLIKRPTIKQITSNSADAGVYDYNYDYVINNDGTLDDLKFKAEDFVSLVFPDYQSSYKNVNVLSSLNTIDF